MTGSNQILAVPIHWKTNKEVNYLILLPLRIEQVFADEHQDEGKGAAEQYPHQGRCKFAESEYFKIEEGEMVDQHHGDGIVEEPFYPLVPQGRGIPYQRFGAAGDGHDHEGAEKSHDQAGGGVETDCIGEDIDAQAQEKSGQKQHPARNAKGQQQDEVDIEIGIDIPPEVDMVQNQYLKKYKEEKPDNIKKDGSRGHGYISLIQLMRFE